VARAVLRLVVEGPLALVERADLQPPPDPARASILGGEPDEAFSFHKLLAPFGVGVLYARQALLEQSLPFLYGGDMVAEGKVRPDRVEYGALPWKFAAGTR
jgi:hypothetical protein